MQKYLLGVAQGNAASSAVPVTVTAPAVPVAPVITVAPAETVTEPVSEQPAPEQPAPVSPEPEQPQPQPEQPEPQPEPPPDDVVLPASLDDGRTYYSSGMLESETLTEPDGGGFVYYHYIDENWHSEGCGRVDKARLRDPAVGELSFEYFYYQDGDGRLNITKSYSDADWTNLVATYTCFNDEYGRLASKIIKEDNIWNTYTYFNDDSGRIESKQTTENNSPVTYAYFNDGNHRLASKTAVENGVTVTYKYYNDSSHQLEYKIMSQPDASGVLSYRYINENFNNRGYGRVLERVMAAPDADGAIAFRYVYSYGEYVAKKYCYRDAGLTDLAAIYETTPGGQVMKKTIFGEPTYVYTYYGSPYDGRPQSVVVTWTDGTIKTVTYQYYGAGGSVEYRVEETVYASSPAYDKVREKHAYKAGSEVSYEIVWTDSVAQSTGIKKESKSYYWNSLHLLSEGQERYDGTYWAKDYYDNGMLKADTTGSRTGNRTESHTINYYQSGRLYYTSDEITVNAQRQYRLYKGYFDMDGNKLEVVAEDFADHGSTFSYYRSGRRSCDYYWSTEGGYHYSRTDYAEDGRVTLKLGGDAFSSYIYYGTSDMIQHQWFPSPGDASGMHYYHYICEYGYSQNHGRADKSLRVQAVNGEYGYTYSYFSDTPERKSAAIAYATVITWSDTEGYIFADPVAYYTYYNDADNRIESRTVTENGVSATYYYHNDPNNWVASKITTEGGVSVTYTFFNDEYGRIARSIRQPAGAGGEIAYEYIYFANTPNRISEIKIYSDIDRMNQIGIYTYFDDNDNRMAAKTVIENGVTVTYYYRNDANHRIASKVTTENGIPVTYTYFDDADNRIESKTTTEDGITVVYYYENSLNHFVCRAVRGAPNRFGEVSFKYYYYSGIYEQDYINYMNYWQSLVSGGWPYGGMSDTVIIAYSDSNFSWVSAIYISYGYSSGSIYARVSVEGSNPVVYYYRSDADNRIGWKSAYEYGNWVYYTYFNNDANRVEAKTVLEGDITVTYKFFDDNIGRIESKSTIEGGISISYFYFNDENHRIRGISTTEGGVPVTYTYFNDNDHRIESFTTIEAGVPVTYTYFNDEIHRLESISRREGGITVTYHYFNDADHRISAFSTIEGGIPVTYTYFNDIDHRIESFTTVEGGIPVTYRYNNDVDHRRAAKTTTENGLPVTYTYFNDPDNRMESRVTIEGGITVTCYYFNDPDNRMSTKITTEGGVPVTYTYFNDSGNRIATKVTDEGGIPVTYTYFNDNDHRIESFATIEGGVPVTYTYFNDIDHRIESFTTVEGGIPVTYYYYNNDNHRYRGKLTGIPDASGFIYYGYMDEDWQGRGYGRVCKARLQNPNIFGELSFEYDYRTDGHPERKLETRSYLDSSWTTLVATYTYFNDVTNRMATRRAQENGAWGTYTYENTVLNRYINKTLDSADNDGCLYYQFLYTTSPATQTIPNVEKGYADYSHTILLTETYYSIIGADRRRTSKIYYTPGVAGTYRIYYWNNDTDNRLSTLSFYVKNIPVDIRTYNNNAANRLYDKTLRTPDADGHIYYRYFDEDWYQDSGCSGKQYGRTYKTRRQTAIHSDYGYEIAYSYIYYNGTDKVWAKTAYSDTFWLTSLVSYIYDESGNLIGTIDMRGNKQQEIDRSLIQMLEVKNKIISTQPDPDAKFTFSNQMVTRHNQSEEAKKASGV